MFGLTAPSLALACIGVILFPDVARTFILLHVSQTTTQTSTMNTMSTRLEDIIDHVLAQFYIYRLGLFLVGSLMRSIGLVTHAES
jgi:hypothetical protein